MRHRKRRFHRVDVLPIIDLQTEAKILAYEAGRESLADKDDIQQPEIGVREVQAEIHVDFWTAMQEGVI